MQSQINIIEYQLTPEMAKQLAEELMRLSDVNPTKYRWRGPIIIGLMVAAAAFFSNFPFSNAEFTIGDANFSTISKIISAFLTTAIGFGLGFGGVLLLRKVAFEKTREFESKISPKFGYDPVRKVSWDSTAFTMASTNWETKAVWRIVDRVNLGKIGIHFYSEGRVFYSIPTVVLPHELPVDELIRLWTSLIAQSKQIVKP